ncbi:MAG: hypothetical protein CVU89_16155 [Firmicutes bacterium HGW-Firmicutes-14]|nr:MAG: hypothetical protein CVU89_16155 [Firmicutes bacterium HGW-Firmicutes-14]
MFKKLKLQHTAGFFLLLLFSLAAGQPISDTDIWWHLRVGRYIWQNSMIPGTDPFSFSNMGHLWITHEWLSEVIYYLSYQYGNLYGLVTVNLLLLCLVFTILYRITVLRTGRPFMSIVLTVVAAVLSSPFWVYRPHMFGYAGFMAYIYILEHYKKGRSKLLWCLPLIMVFWVNAHGSYIIGLVLIGIYLVSGLVKKGPGGTEAEPWTREQARNLAFSLAASFAITFLNPNTYKMVIYPFFTIGNSNIVDKINEWSSPDFHEPVFQVFLVVVLAGFLLTAVYEGRHRISDLLLLAAFTGLALFAVRNIALYLFACTPVLGYYLSGLIRPRADHRQYYAVNWLLALVIAFAIFISWPAKNDLSAHQDTSVFPAGAVKYLAENRIEGDIFNDYNWGGYLLWYRYPDNRVFIDGRTDIYADRVFPDYLKVMNLSPGNMEILEDYGPDLILIKTGAALNGILIKRPEWKVIYSDSISVIYKRAEG